MNTKILLSCNFLDVYCPLLPRILHTVTSNIFNVFLLSFCLYLFLCSHLDYLKIIVHNCKKASWIFNQLYNVMITCLCIVLFLDLCVLIFQTYSLSFTGVSPSAGFFISFFKYICVGERNETFLWAHEFSQFVNRLVYWIIYWKIQKLIVI